MLTYREINLKRKQEIDIINYEYDNMLIELENKCNHINDDGTTALEEFCDDDDLGGWRDPTFKTYKICRICGKEISE